MPDRVAIVILAAGGSRRLGRPKQLLMIDGVSLLRRAAQRAIEANVGPVFAVLGAKIEACTAELAGLDVTVIANPDWAKGIGSSIRAGVRAIEGAPIEAALFCTCDQPGIAAADFADLAAIRRGCDAPAAAARYAGTIGIPAVFARREFPALLALPDHAGAKSRLEVLGDRAAVVDLASAATDIDTPADAQRWTG